ncbi:MAG: accessory gene regulator B family protein [Lachnospiraceae bacterium]
MAGKIADSLCHKELIEECDREIYEFGYQVLIENIGKTLLLLLAGGVLHQFITTLIFILAFTSLRSFCGGYHATKSWKCDLVTIFLWGIVIAGTELFVSVFEEKRILLLLIAIVSELIIYQCAPVEHVNKRLTKEKRAKNRRMALRLGLTYGIIILLLAFTLTRISTTLAITVLEVVILMIIPSEGRISNEETDGFRQDD